MSTTNTPVATPGTRTPIARNNGRSWLVNLPVPAAQILGVTDCDSIHIELHRDEDVLTWHLDRSLTRYGGSLYFYIPTDVVDTFNVTAEDSIPVTVYADRAEYELDDHHSLVIKTTPRSNPSSW